MQFALDLFWDTGYTVAMHKSYKVALFLQTARNYGRELINGIIRYSGLYGPWSFYREDQFYMTSSRKRDLSYLKKWGVDGIISRDFINTSFSAILTINHTQWAPASIDGYVQGFPQTIFLIPSPLPSEISHTLNV